MLLSAQPTHAAKLETLIMPGEVISAHAKVEAECTACHARLGDTPQNTLCLDCHEEVAEDLQSRRGFHGRAPGLADRECRGCHTDHTGRAADIVKLNKDTFDHDGTDFKLKDAHVGLSCDSCHSADQAFRAAPGACIDCHRADDPHQQRLGEHCADCHSERAWTETDFDHSQTEFALQGAHKEVTCGACHPDQRYEQTPGDCYACHALNDVHRGRNGQKCADCHTEQRWDEVSFDHTQDTKFPLRGRHAKLDCEVCHTDAPAKLKLQTDCIACHRADDSHHGRNGTQCASCHGADSWTDARFDHDRKTDFPLRGKHGDLACNTCHRGKLTDALGGDCIDCHRADDVHRGKQGADCMRCHQESGWGDHVVFDHDLTPFPLIGLHATVACEECHVSAVFQDVAQHCNDCHAADDVHQQGLGQDCAACHNPNGWSLWEFDHDTATEYPLRGAHRDLICAACHGKPVQAGADVALATNCSACHAQDDVHRGRFGQSCERCHTEQRFDQVEMRR